MLSSQSLHFDELMLSCRFKGDAKMEKELEKQLVMITDNYLHMLSVSDLEKHLGMKNAM